MNIASENIQLSYLYRDAGNYKLFGQVIFRNPEKLSPEEIKSKLLAQLIDGEFFDAEKWGLPVLQFENYHPDMDHPWHEIEKIESTAATISDSRTLTEFLLELQKC
ncbi:MAG: hypothetical protein CVT94_18850 [Bacteroidetes bacterium HGW-Bacteroidetes-11]|jgi:hypothetical protein|nr:MAG: hypothetical protein CVT94_18850 [Bacteroidetes bacterium HGW-Bacteroidetes-11]